MAYTVKIDGRRFNWNGGPRITYVSRRFPRRWVEVSRESASHVVHAWLPTYDSPWAFKIRKVEDA